jgi:hypothetical protein
MCPFCISTAALVAGGAIPAGGLVTLAVMKLRSKPNRAGASGKAPKASPMNRRERRTDR